MPQGDWLPQTRAWWETWASSEQGEHFSPTSWMRLVMVMELVQQFFTKPTKELLAEIRANESKLGGCPEDLLRLRWQLKAPPAPSRSRGTFDHLKERLREVP